jgi:hypothetical protein
MVTIRVGANTYINISKSNYESICETASILGDRDTMRHLKKSLAELRQGKTIPWKTVKRDLGL